MATPETSSAAARAERRVCRQEVPSRGDEGDQCLARLPGDDGAVRGAVDQPGGKPAGVLRVAANVQAVPFGER